jgi:hypothetical protein
MNLRHKFIRHNRNMDICYLVNKVFDTGKKLKLSLIAFNMGYTETYRLNIQFKAVIFKEELKNWQLCLDSNAKCLRYSEWKQI